MVVVRRCQATALGSDYRSGRFGPLGCRRDDIVEPAICRQWVADVKQPQWFSTRVPGRAARYRRKKYIRRVEGLFYF